MVWISFGPEGLYRQGREALIEGDRVRVLEIAEQLLKTAGLEPEGNLLKGLILARAGKRDEAIAAVPDDFADEISLVGPASRIKERLEHWRNSPITELLISARSPEALRQAAELVNG